MVPDESASAGPVPARRASSLPAVLATLTVAWGGNQFTPLLGTYETLRGFDQLTVNLLLFSYVGGIIPALFLAARAQRRLRLRTLAIGVVALSLVGSILLATAGSTVPQLMVGRILSGIALGGGMVSGSAWIRLLVLTRGPITTRLLAAAARSTALALTNGFGLGATAAGVLARFAPYPLAAAYLPHLLLAAGSLVLIAVTARRVPAGVPVRRADRPRAANAGMRTRLLVCVLPVAPLIFGSLGLAYAILPQRLVAAHGPVSSLYPTLLCAATLTAGFAIQQGIRRVPSQLRFPAPAMGVSLFIVLTVIAALTLDRLEPVGVLVLSSLLGVAYGLVISGCLARVQMVTPPGADALMSALVYALAYAGFGLPFLLSWANQWLDYSTLLLVVAAVAMPPAVITQVAGMRLHPHRENA